MSYLSVRKAARKDFLTCLGIWIALEAVCFFAFPMLNMGGQIRNLDAWFLWSLPLGIGGSFLLGASVQVANSVKPISRTERVLRALLGQLLSWIGLVGVAFPLLVGSIILISGVLKNLMSPV